MKIFDFSNLNFNNEYLTESTLILSSESFNFNNSKSIRFIVSDLNKRLVFLLPSKSIISNSGYSSEESNSIIESFSIIENDLFESVLPESDNNQNPSRFLPRVHELNRKDIWRELKFKFIDNNQWKGRPCIVIDSSDKFSERFVNGLILAMEITSSKSNRPNILLEDWEEEGLSKVSYAKYNSIQQLPIERFLRNPRKIGVVSDNDWRRIKDKNPNVDSLKIKNQNDTTSNRRVRRVSVEENYSHLYKLLKNFK